MKPISIFCVACAALALASPAAAQSAATEATVAPAKEAQAWETAPAERRSGFTAGLSFGLGLGSAAGFPNDVKKIGFERYYTETGIVPGGATELWIGGALADWFTFGFGVGGSSLSSSSEAAGAGGFTFRMEAFPLYSLGDRYRDLGVTILTGTGSATVTPADDTSTKLVDGGAPSRVGLGAFYEGVRVWKFGMGPFASFDYMWSDTVRRPALFLGWRSAIYTGP